METINIIFAWKTKRIRKERIDKYTAHTINGDSKKDASEVTKEYNSQQLTITILDNEDTSNKATLPNRRPT